jgi:hypothetical protein
VYLGAITFNNKDISNNHVNNKRQCWWYRRKLTTHKQRYRSSDSSSGFTYRLDRLKPRASRCRGLSAKVHTIVNTVIGLSHLCRHSVLYFLNNPSVIFLIQLHSIPEYCRIWKTLHHLRLYSNRLNTLPSSSSREGGELGEASQVD